MSDLRVAPRIYEDDGSSETAETGRPRSPTGKRKKHKPGDNIPSFVWLVIRERMSSQLIDNEVIIDASDALLEELFLTNLPGVTGDSLTKFECLRRIRSEARNKIWTERQSHKTDLLYPNVGEVDEDVIPDTSEFMEFKLWAKRVEWIRDIPYTFTSIKTNEAKLKTTIATQCLLKEEKARLLACLQRILSYNYWSQRSSFSNSTVLDSVIRYKLKKKSPSQRLAIALQRIKFHLYVAAKMVTMTDVIMLCVSAVLTQFCIYFNLGIGLNPSIVMGTMVFPTTFALNSAFSRRQQALDLLAEFRVHSLNLFINFKVKRFRKTMKKELQVEVKRDIQELFQLCRCYITQLDEHLKLLHLQCFYNTLYTLRNFLEEYSGAETKAEFTGIAVAFEKLRNIADYQTPVATRTFIYLVILLYPFFTAPLCDDVEIRRLSSKQDLDDILVCPPAVCVHDARECSHHA